MSTVRLVCGNCGMIEHFTSWDAADEAGWDTVARFGYNACHRCPGVSVYLPMYYAQQARAADDPAVHTALLEQAAAATMEFAPR